MPPKAEPKDEDNEEFLDTIEFMLHALDRLSYLWVSNDKGHIIEEPDMRAVAAEVLVEMFNHAED